MQILTGKSLHRRTFLQGMGAVVALPYLDAMEPAFKSLGRLGLSNAAKDKTRLVAIELVHGAAGSNNWGDTRKQWAPAKTGHDFELTAQGPPPALEPLRQSLRIV